MPHTVSIAQFSGPLDLLLEQAERGVIKLTSISIAEITHQYLERLTQIEASLDADSVSQFAQLGARLLYIKSLALLPEPAVTEQTAELNQLNQELARYQVVKQYATSLAGLNRHTAAHPAAPLSETVRLKPAPATFSLNQLSAAYIRLQTKKPPALPKPSAQPGPSIQQVADMLYARLQQRLRTRHTFANLLAAGSSRQDIIVAFLATLELMRQHTVSATQSHQFAPITLEATHV